MVKVIGGWFVAKEGRRNIFQILFNILIFSTLMQCTGGLVCIRRSRVLNQNRTQWNSYLATNWEVQPEFYIYPPHRTMYGNKTIDRILRKTFGRDQKFNSNQFLANSSIEDK